MWKAIVLSLVAYCVSNMLEPSIAAAQTPKPSLAFYFAKDHRLLQVEVLGSVDLSQRTLIDVRYFISKVTIEPILSNDQFRPDVACLSGIKQKVDPKAAYAIYLGPADSSTPLDGSHPESQTVSYLETLKVGLPPTRLIACSEQSDDHSCPFPPNHCYCGLALSCPQICCRP